MEPELEVDLASIEPKLASATVTHAKNRSEYQRWMAKCMDQVCSGRVHWQTHMMAAHAEALGCRLVDSILVLGEREQPSGRRQVHVRRNYSTLLVLELER